MFRIGFLAATVFFSAIVMCVAHAQVARTQKELTGLETVYTSYGTVYGTDQNLDYAFYVGRLGGLSRTDFIDVSLYFMVNTLEGVALSMTTPELAGFKAIKQYEVAGLPYAKRKFVETATTMIDRAVDGGDSMVYGDEVLAMKKLLQQIVPQRFTNAKEQQELFKELFSLAQQGALRSKIVKAALAGRTYSRPQTYHDGNDGHSHAETPFWQDEGAIDKEPVVAALDPVVAPSFFLGFRQAIASLSACSVKDRFLQTRHCPPFFGERTAGLLDDEYSAGSGGVTTASCSGMESGSQPKSCAQATIPSGQGCNGLTHPVLGGKGARTTSDGDFGDSRGGGSRSHKGFDINVPGGPNDDCGTPVHAGRSGFVSRCQNLEGDIAGNIIVLDHCDGTFTRYFHMRPSKYIGKPAGGDDTGNHGGGHCAAFGIKVGQYVEGGRQIGEMGRANSYRNRGMSCHLHFEVRNGAFGSSQAFDPNKNNCLIDLEKKGGAGTTTCNPANVGPGDVGNNNPLTGESGSKPVNQSEGLNNVFGDGKPGQVGTSIAGGRETANALKALFEDAQGGDANYEEIDGGEDKEGNGELKEDDGSAGEVIGEKYEHELDYTETMAWADDFEQHARELGPTKCVYCLSEKCCADMWKQKRPDKSMSSIIADIRSGKLACPCELKPTCSVKVNYTEPTVHVEVQGQGGFSQLLRMKSNVVDDTAHSDGGRGARGRGWAFYEAHVAGISPAARFSSSSGGDDKLIKKSLVCDLASWGKDFDYWEDMTVEGTTTPNIMQGDKLAKTPKQGVMQALSGWKEMWFESKRDDGKDVALASLFISESERSGFEKPVPGQKGGWVSNSAANTQQFNAEASDLLSRDRCATNTDFSKGGTGKNDSDGTARQKGCIGTWGAAEPLNGWTPALGEYRGMAHVSAKAYEAMKERVYPYGKDVKGQAGRGIAIPKVQAEHVKGWAYWTTMFNLEWPRKSEKWFMLGHDPRDWEGMLVQNKGRTMGLDEWRNLDLAQGTQGDDLRKDGMVMTLWKHTTCRIHHCCKVWPEDHCWEAKDPWKILRVDEIDDWETEDASSFREKRN